MGAIEHAAYLRREIGRIKNTRRVTPWISERKAQFNRVRHLIRLIRMLEGSGTERRVSA